MENKSDQKQKEFTSAAKAKCWAFFILDLDYYYFIENKFYLNQ